MPEVKGITPYPEEGKDAGNLKVEDEVGGESNPKIDELADDIPF